MQCLESQTQWKHNENRMMVSENMHDVGDEDSQYIFKQTKTQEFSTPRRPSAFGSPTAV